MKFEEKELIMEIARDIYVERICVGQNITGGFGEVVDTVQTAYKDLEEKKE